ncbi:methyltransferase-like protein 2 isoform X2 [Vigna angularis]|uniref:methyltransferase-like protein 2 isoform X2 n=1 Tax=Phaseolus angularis TaxID=3914 RepID=UPI00080A7842|nr:methyltransferase-like protein 2 isoform X2 [Vigna angularis]
MEGEHKLQKLSSFYESGIYSFDDSNAVFVDSVRVLNRFYHRFSVSSSVYYSRFFKTQTTPNAVSSTVTPSLRKRKRKRRESRPLNERELIALQRHQEARPLLLAAHKCLLKSTEVLNALKTLKSESSCSTKECDGGQRSFVDLGHVAPQLEVTLSLRVSDNDADPHPLPKDLDAHADSGFNLIMVDPPWENASAHQKSRYQTLPNRYFLSLPIKQLTHAGGALVALWVTNREKLRCFIEAELFPTWGVSYAATFYWLKVKENGSLICDLDLFHHRPYECLILGYSPGKVNNTDNLSEFKPVKNDRVIMSIPGDYSRKPQIADLLLEHVPGLKPPRCIELFAREILAGWVAWGNEPLYFQDSKHFVKKMVQ